MATDNPVSLWRVGKSVPLNVYEGDRPVCQCHTVSDAKQIVAALNAKKEGENVKYPFKRPLASVKQTEEGADAHCSAPSCECQCHRVNQSAPQPSPGSLHGRLAADDTSPTTDGPFMGISRDAAPGPMSAKGLWLEWLKYKGQASEEREKQLRAEIEKLRREDV